MRAALLGDTTTISALLRAGVNVSVQNWRGETALMAAVRASNSDATELLLQHGASVRSRDSLGQTPLLHRWEAGMARRELRRFPNLGSEAPTSDRCDGES